MGRKTKVTVEEKIRAIEDYLSGKRFVSQICFELQTHCRSFYDWLRKYQSHGKQGLQIMRKNTFYSEVTKLQAITDYAKGIGSLDQICNKYDISNHTILLKWIKKYNGHEITKSHNALGDRSMTKGRITTYEERVTIVAFCIENNDNYKLTSERFQVSYQQVYTW